MQNRFQFKRKSMVSILLLALLVIVINTRVVNNLWMILTDASNYIPDHSNIFSFQPTQIDGGSGGYWRYGEDKNNYYYFSVKEENVYIYAPKAQNCKALNQFNYVTWCEKFKAYHVKH